jgi:nucleotide-binding universal stress UspA family protein
MRSKATTCRKPGHILVADDGSENAARARAFAVMLAAATGARFTAVYVREPRESQEEAHRKLAATLAAATAAGLRCNVVIERPVGVTNPGRRILAAARHSHADLIVMGTRGAGLARRLLGSVSAYVVSRGRLSVCMMR